MKIARLRLCRRCKPLETGQNTWTIVSENLIPPAKEWKQTCDSLGQCCLGFRASRAQCHRHAVLDSLGFRQFVRPAEHHFILSAVSSHKQEIRLAYISSLFAALNAVSPYKFCCTSLVGSRRLNDQCAFDWNDMYSLARTRVIDMIRAFGRLTSCAPGSSS